MGNRFLPSAHGFAFQNAWPSVPAVVLRTPLGRIRIGDAGAGLCGGMVFAALDYWRAGVPPPAEQPQRGQPLFRFVVRRLVNSWRVPFGVARYYRWMALPDARVTRRTLDRQWPRVSASLDADRPVPLGVVTVASRRPGDLKHNHQVLAYAYDRDGDQVTLRVYDPNQGPRDDIAIRFHLTGPAGFTHNLDLDRPVRGFFHTGYRPKRPPAG